MQKLAALSIDDHLKKQLKEMTGSSARLHSQFKRTVNYLYQDEMFTIAADSLDNAVLTMRISAVDFEECFSNPPKEIYFGEEGIQVGGYWLIEWREAKGWFAKRLAFPVHSDLLAENLILVKRILKEKNQPTWAHPTAVDKKESTNRFEQMMEKMLYEETEKAFEAIASQPISWKQLNESKLFGLGRGLTPSGDDILTGISFVAALPNFPIHLKGQTRRWSELAKKKTNRISSTAIYQASKGASRESVHEFLESLFYSENSDLLMTKLEKVLAIGSSSGSEIIWGMIRTIEIANQGIENNKEEYHDD